MSRSRSIPIFFNPQKLNFYQTNPSTHKQILTLFNPYNFAVQYKVYSNASSRYTVLEPEGTIPPVSQVDLIFKHLAPTPSNCNMKDIFKIEFVDTVTKEVIGKRTFPARLFPDDRRRDTESEDGDSQYTECVQSSPRERVQTLSYDPHNVRVLPILFLTGFLLGVILWPTKVESSEVSTLVPDYLHLSVPFKMIVAYLVGILTMVLVRPC